jgi:hypothetical protein
VWNAECVRRSDLAAAAESLRRLLDLIDAGEIEASGEDRARIEGALVFGAAWLELDDLPSASKHV